jgi:tetratricopeptide (TPR) repeat protein
MDSNDSKQASREPAPAEVEVVIDGERKRLTYEQAFRLGCVLLGAGKRLDAAKLFKCMEAFTDRGPRAFIMEAFCEAAAMQFDNCGESLAEAFEDDKAIATRLQNAFISYHVGIREEGIQALVELINEYDDLPTICFLLGEMLSKADRPDMAKKCWKLAIERDRKGGAVAAVAARRIKSLSSR